MHDGVAVCNVPVWIVPVLAEGRARGDELGRREFDGRMTLHCKLVAICALILLIGTAVSASAKGGGGRGSGAIGGHGGPVGFQPQAYGSQAFTGGGKETTTQFLGPDTVLGKMFRYANTRSGAASPSK